jgi:hypothetical protein
MAATDWDEATFEAHRPLLFSIAYRIQLVTINGAPGLLMRHPIAGNSAYSFDIADGRIRAIYVVRNPDKLRGFLARTH